MLHAKEDTASTEQEQLLYFHISLSRREMCSLELYIQTLLPSKRFIVSYRIVLYYTVHSIPDCMCSKLTHAKQAKLYQVETSDGIFSHSMYVYLT